MAKLFHFFQVSLRQDYSPGSQAYYQEGSSLQSFPLPSYEMVLGVIESVAEHITELPDIFMCKVVISPRSTSSGF